MEGVWQVGLFDRFRQSLGKTRELFTERLASVLKRRKIDEGVFEELEEVLLSADVGFATCEDLLLRLRRESKRRGLESADELLPVLRGAIVELLGDSAAPVAESADGPTVILVVGVNGAGKTTLVGKLAHMYRAQGKRVLLAAGDTFRAAAVEQLVAWGERAGVDVVRQKTGSDAAAVIFDALQAAKSRGIDVLLCDTAGRLQNKQHLMDELNKVYRVINREIPGAPHEVLLVLDATTGQNGLQQAKVFREAARVTGVALTKLDSTAKGGVVIAVARELGIPVKLVGVGEKIDDVALFAPEDFASALLSADK